MHNPVVVDKQKVQSLINRIADDDIRDQMDKTVTVAKSRNSPVNNKTHTVPFTSMILNHRNQIYNNPFD